MAILKKVINADSGDADHFGGNDIDNVADYFNNIAATGGPAKINTQTQYRSTKLELRNPGDSASYIFTGGAIAADRTLNFPLLTGTDELAVLALPQTFSNKTLDSTCVISSSALPTNVVLEGQANDFGDFDQSFKDNRIRIWNPADTFRYTIVGAAIAANRTLNLPLTTATDTLASLGLAQTWTAAQTYSGGHTVSGSETLSADVYFTGIISPSQITADQNDYAPTGHATANTFRLDADSSFRTITGLSGGVSGRIVVFRNISNNSIMLSGGDTGSSSGNRFDFGDGTCNIPLFAKSSISLQYDGTLTKWVPINNVGLCIPIQAQGFYAQGDIGQTNNTGYFDFTPASGGTAASNAGTVNHPGQIRFTLGTSTTGNASAKTMNNAIILGNSWYWRFETILKVLQLSNGTDNYTLRAGFIDSGTAESTDGVFFKYNHSLNSGNWQLVARDNGSETTSNTSTAVGTSNFARLTIIVNPAGNSAVFYINGTAVGSALTALPTGSTEQTGAGFMFLKSAGTTNSNVIDLDAIEITGYAPVLRST